MFSPAMVGQTHLGSYFCEEWELRITERCLTADLGAGDDAPFEDVMNHEIVKALVKDRFTRTNNTRQVAGLTSGKPVWVLSRGNDHRGGTWFDEAEHVVWLLAYRLHRSGSADDFFPYCRELDKRGGSVLLPTGADYERLKQDRAKRFAFAVRVEAPALLKQAREQGGEQRLQLGGKFGACVALELAEDLEETTVAFLASTVPTSYFPIILAAFHADVENWDMVDQMPSRSLEPGEIAFSHLHHRS